MFAAQSGVDHVYACEMSSTMSSIAEEIIKSNGFSNTITNWKCYSTDITVSDDISGTYVIIFAVVQGWIDIVEKVTYAIGPVLNAFMLSVGI